MVLSKDIKLAICFGLIVGCLFSFFSLCFASEVVSVEGLTISTSTNKFVTSSGGGCKYVSVERGQTYYVTSTRNVNIGLCSDVPDVGVSVELLATSVQSFYYTADSDGYFLVSSTNHPEGYENIDIQVISGLDGFITNLVRTISTEGLWSTFLDCVPLLAIAVLWGLGFFLIVRLVIGIVKARGGV